MLTIRWTLGTTVLVDLTIGGTDDPEPEALHTTPSSGYIGEEQLAEAAFIQAHRAD